MHTIEHSTDMVKKPAQDAQAHLERHNGHVLQPRSADPTDPVRRSTEGWWFWNEVWADLLGPFPTESAADAAMRDYAAQL